ncbi:hypothetical protein FGE05_02575 [Pseudomonas sp. ICMP22404]|nr:hypothetical protein FGE05_02575 [Pseudomonas sp. ICMP22404]
MHEDRVRRQSHCGSEPARDGDGSVTRDVGCADAFASKPAPTGSGITRPLTTRAIHSYHLRCFSHH